MWRQAGDVVPGCFYAWGSTRWRQGEDHGQACHRQELRDEYPINWAGSCLGNESESRCYLVIVGIERGSSPTRGRLGSTPNLPRDMACVILLSSVSLLGKGCSKQSVSDAIQSASGSANIPDDSRSVKKLYYYNVQPQAAVLPGRDSTGHNSFCSPVLQGSSFPQGALYFSLVIWVNGSVLLTDGSLLGVPAKAGF